MRQYAFKSGAYLKVLYMKQTIFKQREKALARYPSLFTCLPDVAGYIIANQLSCYSTALELFYISWQVFS